MRLIYYRQNPRTGNSGTKSKPISKEAHKDMKQQLDTEIAMQEVNKASFRPPHPSDASSAQLDWNDAISPV